MFTLTREIIFCLYTYLWMDEVFFVKCFNIKNAMKYNKSDLIFVKSLLCAKKKKYAVYIYFSPHSTNEPLKIYLFICLF